MQGDKTLPKSRRAGRRLRFVPIAAVRTMVAAATLAIVAGASPRMATAAPPDAVASPSDGHVLARASALRPIADSALDRIRGGFTAPDGGLQIAFGIRQAVVVAGDPAGLATTTTLIQRGSGNLAAAGLLAGAAAATVIQNTLDNQKIHAITTIDVQTNSLQAHRAAGLQSAIGTAIAESLRR